MHEKKHVNFDKVKFFLKIFKKIPDFNYKYIYIG